MLAFGKSRGDSPQCIPNVLPCRIDHNGPVNASERYWLPKESEDGKPISYIRGRKLHGRSVKVPERYGGVVLSSNEKALPKKTKSIGEDLEGGGDHEELVVMLGKAGFDEVVVWGHEVVLDEKDDTYVRGLEEWIAFAEQIHFYSTHDGRRTNESR